MGLIKSYPADLTALCLAVGAGVLVVSVLPQGSTLRFVVAFPLLFLLPGHAAVAFLFPGSEDLRWASSNETAARIALAFGLSLVLVPLTVLAVGAVASPEFTELLGSLAIGTVVVAQLAAARRLRLPQHRRYRPRFRRSLRRSAGGLFGSRRTVSTVAAVMVVVGVVAAGTAIAVAVADPPAANDFTEFYVGTEDENGSVTTSDYPDELTIDDTASLVVGVTNNEGAQAEYTVLAQLQVVDDGEVVERENLDRFENTVPSGETWQHEHQVAPDMTGEDLRLQYLLYRDGPPETPTAENAYHDVHLWVTVD